MILHFTQNKQSCAVCKIRADSADYQPVRICGGELHKHTSQTAGSSPAQPSVSPIGRAHEKALIALFASPNHRALVAAADQLLQILAPGARIEPAISVADSREGTEARTASMPLPLDAGSEYQLTAYLPEGMTRAECQPQVELVARLMDAREKQLRTLRRMNHNVQQLRRAERLQHALYTIAELAGSERDITSILRSMHHTINGLMYAENFYIALAADDGDSVRFPYFADTANGAQPQVDHAYPMERFENSLTWHVIREGKVFMGSIDQVASQVRGQLRIAGSECVHWLGVPLWQGQDAIGALVVQSYRDDRRYRDEDKSLLIYVAQHVQTTLERHSAHIALNRRVAERTSALEKANRVLKQQVVERLRGERLQAALFQIAELAGNNASLDNFYHAVHDVVGGLLYARNFYIALLGNDRETLEFPYSVDEFDSHRAPRKSGRGLTEFVLRTGKPLLCNHRQTLKMKRDKTLEPGGVTANFWLGVPLIIADEPVGVLAVQSYSGEHGYDSRDQDLLTFVSYHIGNALERKRIGASLKQANTALEQRVQERTKALADANQSLRRQILKRERIEQRLKYQTLHDSLTGLPNRNLLLRRLGGALHAYRQDPHCQFAVLFLDLDRFKVINDSVGHMVGDDLLFEAGGRIRSCLKGQDVVARLGGDEFAVLLEHLPDSDEAAAIATRIIATLNTPFELGAKELYTTISIGIALGAPHYRQPEELLRDADTAMYRAKAEGRQRYAIFDDAMRQQATSLQKVENDLRKALNGDEFEPWFQPIVRLSDGQLDGYEALVRWHHPELGLLAPERFLGVAADSGLDAQIDWIMFDLVLQAAPELAIDGRYVAINLSARQFRSARDLDRRIHDRLEQHAVRPEQIRIEITENVLLENPQQVRQALDSLHRSGIRVSLDDFGTGYSSLSYLHQFPLNTLKIDQSFVAGLGAADGASTPVVSAIKALADSQGMDVVAEGIETEEQAAALKQLGCGYGQGFLYAPPRPAEHWLSATHDT